MESQWSLVVALFVAAFIGCVHGGRFLAVTTMPGKSHMMVFSPYLQELARRGHEVTVISSFPLEKPLKNFKDIDVKINVTEVFGSFGDIFERPEVYPLMMMPFFWAVSVVVSNKTLGHPEVQALIQSDQHFDVVILEAFFNEAMYGFAHRFKAPIILLSSSGSFEWIDDTVASPHNYAYVPHMQLGFSDHMTFGERLSNAFFGVMSKLGRGWLAMPQHEAVMKHHFERFEPLPSITELEMSTALVLLNTHDSVGYPRPRMPNIRHVGGYYFKPTQKLPQDLQKFLDEAKDGVIYFSMGSNLQSSQLPNQKRTAILNVFSKLKQQVLWKWEDDVLPGKPDNVKISKWLPQHDILAHPNVRLFITHGGMGGTLESIHHGVPVVGIPIMADQKINMKRAVISGYGLMVAFKELNEDTFSSALRQVLDNPKFREAAKRLSGIFRDRPMSAMEEAIYWTEYVLRHNGTAHMRSAALDLTWYQLLLLDVLGVVALTAVTTLLLVVFVLKRLARVLCSRRSHVKEVKSGKKKN